MTNPASRGRFPNPVKFERENPYGQPIKLREEAIAHVGEGRLDGPLPYARSGKLVANGKEGGSKSSSRG